MRRKLKKSEGDELFAEEKKHLRRKKHLLSSYPPLL
jgi:hypothetical protein